MLLLFKYNLYNYDIEKITTPPSVTPSHKRFKHGHW